MCYNIDTEKGKEKKKMKFVITTDHGSYSFNRNVPFAVILEQYNEFRANGIKATLKCYIVGYEMPIIWNSRTQTFFIQH